MTILTGCQVGAHEPDPMTDGFLTVFIPDRAQQKSGLVDPSGTAIAQQIPIKLSICTACKSVYREVKEEDDD